VSACTPLPPGDWKWGDAGRSPLPCGEGQGRGLRWRGGFTIIEAAIGLLVIALITGALASTFLVGYTIISKEAKQVSADTSASDASLALVRDLSSSTITLFSGTLTPGSANFLALAYGSGPTAITYQIDVNGNLIRSVNLGSPRVVARGLQSLALVTVGCQETVTLTPSAVPTPQTLRVTQRVGAPGCY
jgi:hypothetical protein